MIRTLWVMVVAVALTALFGSELVIWRYLRLPGLERRCRDRPRQWARAILRSGAVGVEIDGFERLGREPRILVANHESWFDVLVLAAFLPVDYRFVAKKELARVPIFGLAWQACGHIAIDRQDRGAAIQSLGEARRQVDEAGPTIIMFPEGTRTADGELQDFKKGAFVLAIQAGVPVVPAGIAGSRAVMQKGSLRVRPGTIRVRIGEPISVGGMTHADRNELAAEARDAVARLRAEAGTIDQNRGGSRSGAAQN